VTAALAAAPRPAFRFRGRSFLALSLAPTLPLDAWLAELDAWTARSPGFFSNRPVILDCSTTLLDKPTLSALVSELAARAIRIMAVEGLEAGSLPVGVPPAIAGGRDASSAEIARRSESRAPVRGAALYVEEPVRSGQSILHPAGDVVVLGSVASGAEIVAGGSIHVYGALRGRAIAGVAGEPGARILCRRFQAELLAIDGLYKAADDIDPLLLDRPVQARVDNDVLLVTATD